MRDVHPDINVCLREWYSLGRVLAKAILCTAMDKGLPRQATTKAELSKAVETGVVRGFLLLTMPSGVVRGTASVNA